MNILLLRLPVNYKLSKTADPCGCVSAFLYNQWLTRYPPLGLLYYGALLKQKKHNIKLIDAELSRYSLKTVIRISKDFRTDIICASVNIFNPKRDFELLRTIKNELGKKLICRGHFPRLYPIESINNAHVDFALTGKGFHTIGLLIDAIENNKSYSNIPGIIFRNNNGWVKTDPEPPYDINTLPFPARELVDNRIYTTSLTTKDKFTTVLASLGCPYECTYCQEKSTPYEHRSTNSVIEEIKDCKNRFGINEIFFLDPTFTIDRKKTIALCQSIINNKIDIKWVARTRPDLVDNELLDIMSKSGCIKIHYGIESGNQQILNNMNRKITISQIKNTIELTARKKIVTFGYFMIGNNNETKKSIKETIDLACSIPLHFAQFLISFPIPHTEILNNNNKVLKMDLWLENYKGKNNTLDYWSPKHTNLSKEELSYWQNIAYLKFYLQAKHIIMILKLKYTPLYILRQFRILLLLVELYLQDIFIRNLGLKNYKIIYKRDL